MNIGMLWFDNSSQTLSQKVKEAAAYYLKKYRLKPNLCLVHPSAIEDTAWGKMDNGITIRPWRPILPGHLWIGVEEMPTQETIEK